MSRTRVGATKSAVFCLLLGATPGPLGATPRPGALAGLISDAVTLQPIRGARLSVEGETRSAVSDESGRFLLSGLGPGTLVLEVSAAGYLPRRIAELVVTAERVVQLVPVPPQRENVEVRASSFAQPLDTPLSAIGMSYEEIRRAPGAFGGDVSRLVQGLPGLAGRDDLRNDIVARGGSPTENLILVDGVEVPSISHFGAQGASGGPISMLSAEVVGDARFLAGGFPARYGDRLSSVLDVALREGSRNRLQAEVDVGTAGAGLIVEGPIGGRGSWLVSARASYVDLVAGAVDASAIPTYQNYQLKAVYELGVSNRVSLVSLGGREKLAVEVAEQDADDPNILDTRQSGWRSTSGLKWQSFFGPRSTGTLILSDSWMDNATDVWDTALDGSLVLRNRSREHESALRYELAHASALLGSLSAGLGAKRLASEIERQQPLGEDNPFSAEVGRWNSYDVRDEYATWQAGGFLQAVRPLCSGLSLTLGARFDHFASADTSRVSPRGSLTYQPRPGLELSLAAGRYYQMPGLVFMRSRPDNARLGPIRADQGVLGAAWTPRRDLRASLELYEKRYGSYPVARDLPSVSLSNLGDAYDTGLLLVPMVSEGKGRAHGIELFVQKKLGRRFYGQASYSWSRSRYSARDGVWRAGDFDLPQVATLLGGVKPGYGFELSLRASYTSGRPYTPYALEASVAQNRGVLDVSRTNAERTPDYYRLDLRADRRFSLFGWANLVLYVEVDNVTDRHNVRGYLWNTRERRSEAEPQAGRMIIGGLNLEL